MYQILSALIKENTFLELYIGRNGEFDQFVASIIKRAQKAFGKERIGMTLVLPYKQKDIEYYEAYYDSIWIPEPAERAHPKGAITKRNRWMVEQCDLLICFVEKEQGGAYTALQYAKKLKKQIINLAVEDDFPIT